MPMARLCVCEDAGSVANEPAAVSACLSCVTGCNTIKPLLELSAIVMDGVLLGNLLLHVPHDGTSVWDLIASVVL